MRLTSYTDYSLRTLIYIAVHSDRRCTVKEISEYYEISQNHIVKIVHQLAKLEYINTYKGKYGGIELALPANMINLGELVRKLEPDFYIAECFNCSGNQCKITVVCQFKNILFKAYQAFIQELEKHTLKSICSNQEDFLELFSK